MTAQSAHEVTTLPTKDERLRVTATRLRSGNDIVIIERWRTEAYSGVRYVLRPKALRGKLRGIAEAPK